MLLSLTILSLMGFGTWGLLRHWRFLVETQLRLDECVGNQAITFRNRIERIESENLALKAARAAALVTIWAPPAHAAAKAAVMAAFAAQEVEFGFWRAEQIAWVTRRCGDLSYRVGTLPSPPWTRDPPDAIGPQALAWPESQPKSFWIQAHYRNRYSAAIVDPASNGEGKNDGKKKPLLSLDLLPKKWSARWSRPKKDVRSRIGLF